MFTVQRTLFELTSAQRTRVLGSVESAPSTPPQELGRPRYIPRRTLRKRAHAAVTTKEFASEFVCGLTNQG